LARKRRSSRLRYAAEYAGWRVLGVLLRALGPDRASMVGGAVSRRVAPLLPRHERALDHLAVAFPAMSLAQREAIARDVWDNIGRTMAEGFLIDRILADPARITIATPQALAALQETGGRFVITSLHAGNWELGAPFLTQQGLPMAGVYQRVKNPHVHRWITAARAAHYPGGLYLKGQAAARRMLAWGKAGNPSAILADQRLRSGIRVPFFGHAAPSTPLPAFLARSLEYPLFAARLVRENGANFRAEIEEVPVPRTNDRAKDVADATASLQALFERWIRDEPGQWMWAHKRWSRRGPPQRL